MAIEKKLLGIAATLAAVVAVGEDMIVGVYARTNMHVEAGAVCVQSDRVWIDPLGVLDKTGEGNWTLPRATLTHPDTATVNVRAGSVTIPAESGSAPTVEKPTSILNRAAFWFDPSVNCDLGIDGASALRLRDVRETETAVPYAYTRAVAMTNYVQSFPQIATKSGNLKYLNFGTLKSGKWMRLTAPGDADGSAATFAFHQNVRHVFAVYQIVSSQGYFISVNYSDNIAFHPYYSSGVVTNPLLSRDASTCPPQISARCYVNGKRCDPTITKPEVGAWMVLEFQFCGQGGSVDNLFNDRNSTDRQGGDYLGEIIAFTNTLSEVERIQVETYLCNRWSIACDGGKTRLAVATGAQANLSDDERAVSVVGEGRLAVVGEGTPALSFVHPDFHGTVALADGESLYVRDDVYAYEAAAGDRLTVVSNHDNKGDLVTRTANAAADTFVKDGNGAATVRTVADGIKRLSVEGGTLTLSQPYTGTLVSGSDSTVTVTNGSFENAVAITSSSYYYMYNNWNGGSEENRVQTKADWTGRLLAAPGGGYEDSWGAVFSATHSSFASSTIPYKSYPAAPDGNWAFCYRGYGAMDSHIFLPVDGSYVLSFFQVDLAGFDADNHGILEVWVGSDEAHLTRYATTVPCSNLGYRRYVCRLPDMTAGSKVLRLQVPSTDKDHKASLSIDDVRIVFDPVVRTGFLVPNGGFEQYTPTGNYATKFSTAGDTPDGWTFTQVNWSGTATVPSASIVRYGTQITSAQITQFVANMADMEFGSEQLFLASAGGGKVETSFKPPKTGLFVLRAKAGAFIWPNRTSPALETNPAVEASVALGGGSPVSLGIVTRNGRQMIACDWPVPVEITDTNVVLTLAVSNTVVNSAALLDDFEFVPYAGPAANLLANGDFEANESWQLVSRNDTNNTWTAKSSASYRGFTSQYYGYDGCSGLKAMSLIDFGGCYQDVTFPYAGRYRLRFHTRARYDHRSPGYYSTNAKMRAVLAKDGVTNVIVSLATPTTNFVGHTVYFDIPTANVTYTFGFEADNDQRITGQNDRMSFIDDASIVYVNAAVEAAAHAPLDMPEYLAVSVSAGARLVADFAGTCRIGSMRLGNRRVSGDISAASYPDYISGAGAFYVQPKGVTITFK